MTGFVSKVARADAGTALIEFAIVAPVLLFLLVGLVEMGRYTYFAIIAANAARAGVAYGAQTTVTMSDTAGMKYWALRDAQNLPHLTASPLPYYCEANGSPTPCPSAPPTPPVYYYVEVDTNGTYSTLFNYPGIPNNIPISGKAVMRVIQQ